MIVDGKVADANGFILIKKGKSKTASQADSTSETSKD